MKNTLFLLLSFLTLINTYGQRRKNDPVTEFAATVVEYESQKSAKKQSIKNQENAEQDYNKAMEELAKKISSDLSARDKKRVAVVNFSNTRNATTELGKFLAEEFSTLLFNKKLTVVDRGQLEYLMNENKIGAKGMLNPGEVTKLGKLAGVQVIITGTITLFDKQVKLALKGIDVEQGVVVAAVIGTIPRTEAIDQLYDSETEDPDKNGDNNPPSPTQNKCKPAPDCKKLSLGGICVTNKSSRTIEVHVWGQGGGEILIHAGKTEGFNQIPIKGDFKKTRVYIQGDGRKSDMLSLPVEACKVNAITIN